MPINDHQCLTMQSSRLIVSPTAQGTNRLLWGDWHKGELGILVRSLDLYDKPDKLRKRVELDPWFLGGNATALLPASFVHASMRAPNCLFDLPHGQVVAALLVGSHYDKNTVYSVEHVVESPVCYPLDAGSNRRMGMLQQDHGRGCRIDGIAASKGMCMNGTCLFEPKTNCACQYEQVPPAQFGAFFSKWLQVVPRVKKQGELTGRTDLYSCWFDNSLDNMRNMITASNSYWFAQTGWSIKTDRDYRGWTECPVTSNIKTDMNVIDAIVVQLPIGITSLCGLEKRDEDNVLYQLNVFHERGYANLPIVLLQQTNGMNQTECNQVWNGKRCRQGYRKEIFSQTYEFNDGSCLAIPSGCNDVYYFPVDNTTKTCIVTSAGCKEFERNSVFHSKVNTGLTQFEQQVMFDSESPFASTLPSSHLPVIVNLLAMTCLYFAFRKGGGTKSTLTVIPKMFLMTLTLILFPMFLMHARIGHVISSESDPGIDIAVAPRQMATNDNAVVIVSESKDVVNIETASKSAGAPSLENVACPATLPDDTRMVLLTVVQAFHGSTALASVLMSSPMIASYCSGKTWQCEGFAQVRNLACPLKTPCLRDKRQLLPKDKNTEKRRDFNLMDLMSFKWNLTRPVLHDKLFPREPGYTELWEHSLARREVSPQMQKAGVRKVTPAYIIMWTPLCVLNVQKRSRTALSGPTVRKFLQMEVWNLQQMKQQHEALRKSSTPVLVVSYADLLFREQYTLDRMNEFLPCAGGSMNADFVPQLGVDVFPENKWKVRGTVHDFSVGLDPTKCCGYDVKESKCSNRTYFELIPELKNELNELDAYFQRYS